MEDSDEFGNPNSLADERYPALQIIPHKRDAASTPGRVRKVARMKTENTSPGPLGKEVSHSPRYNPGHLFPVPRAEGRLDIGLGRNLPFQGNDIWNAYEMSWLNDRGRPEIAIGWFVFPCSSENLIESKSLKLYLNSLNLERFDSAERVQKTVEKDLSAAAGGGVAVTLLSPGQFGELALDTPPGKCLDNLDIEVHGYRLNPKALATTGGQAEEKLCSILLRTNCPVTGQPDWGSVVIGYKGPRIDPEGLLKYIVSYREHTGFHENCVERMFHDLSTRCAPEKLFIQAHFTRRGGLDINPWRANYPAEPVYARYPRQ